MDELNQRGFRYYFQYTVLGYPNQIDTKGPPREAAIAAFQELADLIGPEHLIWRYDPIVFSLLTGASYHAENFAQIAAALKGYTYRSVVSVMDMYKKFQNRIDQLNRDGLGVVHYAGKPDPRFDDLMKSVGQAAVENGMQIQSCAEELDLAIYGIQPGKCIDDKFILQTFGLDVEQKKDPGQRKACGCVVSKDIGMYDSCLFGCQYCYATASFERARVNYGEHDPQSPSLVGWYDVEN